MAHVRDHCPQPRLAPRRPAARKLPRGRQGPTRTLANLPSGPAEKVETLRAVLRGDKLVPVGEGGFEIRRSLPHGHVLAALTTARHVGFDDLLPRRAPRRRRDLALALIIARLLDPAAKL